MPKDWDGQGTSGICCSPRQRRDEDDMKIEVPALYFSSKWNVLDFDDISAGSYELNGGSLVVSQGRGQNPIVVTYARSQTARFPSHNFEICVASEIKLEDLAEDPKQVLEAASEEEAVDLLNEEYDVGAHDLISDVAQGKYGSQSCRTVDSGSIAGLATHKEVQIFLVDHVKELFLKDYKAPVRRSAMVVMHDSQPKAS